MPRLSSYRLDRSLNHQIASQLRTRRKGKKAIKKLSASMERLKAEMEKIREEQQSIKEGQRQVGEKFKAKEEDCGKQRQVREKSKAIECDQQRQVREKLESMECKKQRIKGGQRQVREIFKALVEEENEDKFKAIKEGCKQLKRETNQMIKHSATAQIGLNIMLKILKAREQGDLAKAAHLTQLLRFYHNF